MEAILAVLLILSPLDAPVPSGGDFLCPAVVSVGTQLEICDGGTREELSSAVYTLRYRYAEMQDCPWLETLGNLPRGKWIDECLALNWQFQQDLRARLNLTGFHEEQFKEALYEAEQLYAIWQWLFLATAENYGVCDRREALRNLREAIGHDAFWSGQVPFCLPLHRIPVIN